MLDSEIERPAVRVEHPDKNSTMVQIGSSCVLARLMVVSTNRFLVVPKESARGPEQWQ